MPIASEISQLLGARIAELRQNAGRRQEDIAREARRAGLTWTRATVAAIETGRREVPLDEMLLLPAVLDHACGLDVRLVDLVPDPFPGEDPSQPYVRLSPRIATSYQGLRRMLSGGDGLYIPLMSDAEAERVQAAKRPFANLLGELADEQHDEAAQASKGEAERKAARTLGVLPALIGPASFLLWERSLSDERDARITERMNDNDSARALQAKRGHVTRALINELRAFLDERGITRSEPQEER